MSVSPTSSFRCWNRYPILPQIGVARSHRRTQLSHPTADTARAPSLRDCNAQDQLASSTAEGIAEEAIHPPEGLSIAGVIATDDTDIESRVRAVLSGGRLQHSGLPPLAGFMPQHLLSRVFAHVESHINALAKDPSYRGCKSVSAAVACVVSDFVWGARKKLPPQQRCGNASVAEVIGNHSCRFYLCI